jgi:hypothetical protein
MTVISACSQGPDESGRVVVVVSAASDLALEASALRVSSAHRAPQVLTLGSEKRWPVVLTLVPAGGEREGDVIIEATTGSGESTTVLASRHAHVRFSRAKRYWYVHLARCESACKDDQTCSACGVCTPVVDAPLLDSDPREHPGSDESCNEPPVPPEDGGKDGGSGDGGKDGGQADAGEDGGQADAGEDGSVGQDRDAGAADSGVSCPEWIADDWSHRRPLVVLDFDGDARPDLAVGYPQDSVDSAPNAGRVAVYRGSTWDGSRFTGPPLHWDQKTVALNGRNEAGDACGAALAAGDFNGDGVMDLAVGCPGEDRETLHTIESGSVNLLFGNTRFQNPTLANGRPIVDGSGQFIDQSELAGATNPESYDHFGSSLAALDFNGDGIDDLAVGAPGEGVKDPTSKVTFADAGVVNTALGKKGVGIDTSQEFGITQLTASTTTYGVIAGTDDAVQDDDAFGVSVTSTKLIYEGLPRPALLIGATGENVATGTLHIIVADPTRGLELPLVRAVLRGDAGPGGHFGRTSLGVDQKYVFVSAPSRGGQVTRFDLSQSWDAVPVSTLVQHDSRARVGSESEDDFGWSLALWRGLLAVGIRGDERRHMSCRAGAVETYNATDFSFAMRYEVGGSLGLGSALAPMADGLCAVSDLSDSAPAVLAP